jgi:hypothetical protein
MHENKEAQQQQRHGERNRARHKQALRARLCFASHAERRSEAKPILPRIQRPMRECPQKEFLYR